MKFRQQNDYFAEFFRRLVAHLKHEIFSIQFTE